MSTFLATHVFIESILKLRMQKNLPSQVLIIIINSEPGRFVE